MSCTHSGGGGSLIVGVELADEAIRLAGLHAARRRTVVLLDTSGTADSAR